MQGRIAAKIIIDGGVTDTIYNESCPGHRYVDLFTHIQMGLNTYEKNPIQTTIGKLVESIESYADNNGVDPIPLYATNLYVFHRLKMEDSTKSIIIQFED